MALDTIVIVLLGLMLLLAFGIGANDETMATVVGSRAIKLKTAIILGAGLVFIGVLLLSADVGETVGAKLLDETNVTYTVHMMLAILISTTIWLIVASQTGAPISTTHSVVGSVFGIAIVYAIRHQISFFDALNLSKMGEVVLGWVISPILGFAAAFLFQKLVDWFMKRQKLGLDKLEKSERWYLYFLLGAVCWTQISRGGNDSANALGIMYGLIESGDLTDPSLLVTMLLIGTGLMLAFGLVVVGKNVIENVGNNLIEMRPSTAFSIQISTSIVIFLATMLGLPVSGSHILIFAVIGAGRVKGESPDKKSFRKMVVSWIITFPVAAALSAVCYLLFLGIF